MSVKLSVALPVPVMGARSKRLSTTLTAAVTTGTTSTISVADSLSHHTVRDGDILKLGPSTVDGYEGQYEQHAVISASASTIGFQDTIGISLASSDSVSGTGSVMPQGWKAGEVSTTATDFYGVNPRQGYSGKILEGAFDMSSGFYLGRYQPATTDNYSYVKAVLPCQLMPSTYYRLKAHVRNEIWAGTQASYFTLRLYDHSPFDSGVSNHTADIGATYSSWTLVESGAVSRSNSLINYGRAELWILLTGAADFYLWGVDNFMVTHAAMTTGASVGYYTFPKDPETLNINPVDHSVLQKFIESGNGMMVDHLNSMPKKVRMRFPNVSAEFIQQLEILQYWQDRGSALHLELDTDTRPLNGFMDYYLKFDHWDLTSPTVEFSFIGV